MIICDIILCKFFNILALSLIASNLHFVRIEAIALIIACFFVSCYCLFNFLRQLLH